MDWPEVGNLSQMPSLDSKVPNEEQAVAPPGRTSGCPGLRSPSQRGLEKRARIPQKPSRPTRLLTDGETEAQSGAVPRDLPYSRSWLPPALLL